MTGARLAEADNVRGMLLMALAGVFFSSMHATVRFVSQEMHPFEIAFFRQAFGVAALLPLIWHTGLAQMRTARFGTHLMRGVLQAASMLAWFTALSLLPLAEATALNFTSPLFAAIAARLIFREAAPLHRWLAIGAGFAGVLVIVRPGAGVMSTGASLVILSTMLVAGAKLMAKSLTETDSVPAIVIYLGLVSAPISLLAALPFWQWPTTGELGLLLGLGVAGSLAHLCFTQAYAYADITAVEPMTYVRLIFAAILGYVVFGEIPGIWTWAGGLVIAASAYAIVRQERAQAAAGTA